MKRVSEVAVHGRKASRIHLPQAGAEGPGLTEADGACAYSPVPGEAPECLSPMALRGGSISWGR